MFAQRFRALEGEGAISCLTSWRINVAAGLLLEDAGLFKTVAGWMGYRSEAAFSIAFGRWAGEAGGLSE
jgi:transcriptional regulator GlxA family with amidase domain